MTSRSGSLQMANRLMEGRLAEEIQRYRAAGVAWAAIVRLLEEHGVVVSERTLRESWAAELGIEDTPIEAVS